MESIGRGYLLVPVVPAPVVLSSVLLAEDIALALPASACQSVPCIRCHVPYLDLVRELHG